MRGASAATPMKRRTQARPKTALLRRNRRRSALRSGPASSIRATFSLVAAVMASASRAQARIGEEIGHVRADIEEDVERRRHQHHTLHHREVAIEDGVDDELAEAGNGEDLLGEHRAREELAKLEGAQGDHRDQRVAQGMAQYD